MNLKNYLRKEGITQAEFGAKLSPPVSQGLVWQWLAGVTRVSLSRAIEIERVTKKAVSIKDCNSMYGPQQEASHA